MKNYQDDIFGGGPSIMRPAAQGGAGGGAGTAAAEAASRSGSADAGTQSDAPYRPLIGISCQIDRDIDKFSKENYSVRPRYVAFVEIIGGAAVLLPPDANEETLAVAAAACDGIILPGGNDVNPACYGQERLETTDKPQPTRDASEAFLARSCLHTGMPLLGVCRGYQMINVALGGTMFQEVSQRENALAHFQPAPFDVPSHWVKAVAPSPIADMMGSEPFMVNSMHHQGVDEISPFLVPAARAEDGLVESLFCPEADFFGGVQWHPEYMPHAEVNVKLGRAFIEAARRYHERKLQS